MKTTMTTSETTPAQKVLLKLKDAIHKLNGQLFSDAKLGNNYHSVYGLNGGKVIILVEYRNQKGILNGCDIFYPSTEHMTDPTIEELKKFAAR